VTPSKRDANEAVLVEFWRSCGCVWIPMSREAGFDGLLICPRTGMHIVEVKNPKNAKGLRSWQMTPNERKRQIEVEECRVPYSIIEDEAQAAELIGITVFGGKHKEAK